MACLDIPAVQRAPVAPWRSNQSNRRIVAGPAILASMQDRYAGDLGDYLKFGLLRWLTGSSSDEPSLRLGAVWYLVRDEAHNADGKYISYLDPAHSSALLLRSLDTDLYTRLAAVVGSGRRSVIDLQRAGVLPRGACTYAVPLDLSDLRLADRPARINRRRAWLEGAMVSTADADLIFVDPDNGVRRPDHPVPRHRTKSVKHAYFDELAAFADRGQSVIAYHHADRSAPVPEQVRRRLADLAEALPMTEVLGAVIARRGTTRLYVVAAAPLHAERLRKRLSGLENGPWGAELVLHGLAPERG